MGTQVKFHQSYWVEIIFYIWNYIGIIGIGKYILCLELYWNYWNYWNLELYFMFGIILELLEFRNIFHLWNYIGIIGTWNYILCLKLYWTYWNFELYFMFGIIL